MLFYPAYVKTLYFILFFFFLAPCQRFFSFQSVVIKWKLSIDWFSACSQKSEGENIFSSSISSKYKIHTKYSEPTENCLSSRSQRVVVSGTGSKMSVSSGEPQVSILGPILFNLSINDLDAVMNQFNHREVNITNSL